MRLLVTNEEYNNFFYKQEKYASSIKTILQHESDPKISHGKANVIMSLRLAANSFSQAAGKDFLLSLLPNILEMISSGITGDQAVQLSAATLAFNTSLYVKKEDQDTNMSLISCLVHHLSQPILNNGNEEVQFTELMALGRLCHCNTEACDLAKTLEFKVVDYTKVQSQKVQQVAKELALLLA